SQADNHFRSVGSDVGAIPGKPDGTGSLSSRRAVRCAPCAPRTPVRRGCMSTIADVAARAGVSKATASRALTGRGYVSEETRRRVADAADELAYVAHSSATSLATGRTGTIAVIVPSIDRWFFAELLAGAQEALLDAGQDLALYSIREGSRTR